ncbi:MAG: hypothetical protein K0R61_43 [Microvirga sp.]|jgi:hypothetical protein|nr:hypothetical protein [Microvirga sp.]MDF2969593.1 hypothetical protein [Microvirga sp.]
MNRRDKDKLELLLLKLTGHFSDGLKQSVTIFRGDARAIVAAIRELNRKAPHAARDGAVANASERVATPCDGKQCHPTDPHCIYPECQSPPSSSIQEK